MKTNIEYIKEYTVMALITTLIIGILAMMTLDVGNALDTEYQMQEKINQHYHQ